MKRSLAFQLPALLFLTAVATAEPSNESFVRSIDLPEKLSAIQTRTVEYRPRSGAGPGIVLVGAAHLGTPEYYASLQQRLDACSVVLFEGVGLAQVLKAGPGALHRELGLQKQLADALGLVFQLNAIDYRRPHFLNSDLAAEEVQSEIQERTAKVPGTKSEETFASLMEALQGTGKGAEMLQPLLALLGGSDQTRETTRLLFIEILGRAGEFLTLAKGASPEMRDLFEVILTERNEIVMRDLRAQLAKRKAGENVAIFYGAAHLPEIAERISRELLYAPAEEHWVTAFTADPAKAGIQPAQIRLILDMAAQQLKAGGPGLALPGLTGPSSPSGSAPAK